jgi:hypothetical protein
MKNIPLILTVLASWPALFSCATVSAQTVYDVLTDDQLADLIDHPAQWDRRTVRIRIFPVDNGYTESYLVCYEACTPEAAQRSPAIVYTSPNRFRGYRGTQAVVITARYSSACFYTNAVCADLRDAQFFEAPPFRPAPPR